MYRLVIIVISILILSSSKLLAQNNISGSIKDEKSGELLSGVAIYIVELKIGSISNVEGQFQFSNIPSGKYFFEIKSIGYKTKVRSFVIDKDTVIDFTLSATDYELKEVIVTGVTRATEVKLSPIIIKTINQHTINQSASTNIIDGLKNIPGIHQISSGVSISKPVIRGLGYNRVITLQNGMRQEGQQWGDEHGIEMDEFSIERVEIIKGPGSLLYGSDGIAGVVNFLSPQKSSNEEIHSQLVTNYQSNNNLWAYSFSNHGNKKDFQWFARISNKFAGNYKNSVDGQVFNSGFKELNGNVSIGIDKKWGYSKINFTTFNTILNLVEGERDSSGNFSFVNSSGDSQTADIEDYKAYKIGFPHQKINHLSLSSNNYFIVKKGSIHLDLGFQNNRRREFGNPMNPHEIELYFNLNTFQFKTWYNLERYKKWDTSIGVAGMQQSNTNKGLDFLIPQYQLYDIGIFATSQKSFQNFTLSYGLRLDTRFLNSKELLIDSLGKPISTVETGSEMKFNAFTKKYSGISASIGMSIPLNTSVVKFNISRGFRMPNISELSANGKHEGAFRYEIGNQTLKPELSHQLDIAYYLHSDHFTIEITPFANFINRFIFIEKMQNSSGLDSILDPSEPTPLFTYVSGNAQLLGGEIYVDFHPHPLDWLHLENSFSFVQATQNNKPDSLKYLPFIPAPKYRGEVKAQFKNIGKFLSNAYIKCGIDHYFKQNNILKAYGTETETNAYTLFSLGLGSNITLFKRHDFVSLYVSVENITNVAYQSHLSRLKYAPVNLQNGRTGVYNMGRNFSVKMIFNLTSESKKR